MRFEPRAIITGIVLLLGTVLPPVSAADVIDLTTGERVRGTIKGATATGVVIDVGGRERVIEQRLIRGIVFDSAPAPARKPGAKPRPAPSRETARAAAPPTTPAPPPPPPESKPAPEPEGKATEPGPTAAIETPPAPAPPPPRPALDLARVSPATLREAMQALRDLRAAAVGGTSRADYAARSDEAKPRVERYLSGTDGRAEIKEAIASAMRLYSFAATAWDVYAARGDFAAVGRDPILAECPRLQKVIAEDAARWHFDAKNPGFAGMIAGSEGLQDLWACAAERLGEAEQRVAAQTP